MRLGNLKIWIWARALGERSHLLLRRRRGARYGNAALLAAPLQRLRKPGTRVVEPHDSGIAECPVAGVEAASLQPPEAPSPGGGAQCPAWWRAAETAAASVWRKRIPVWNRSPPSAEQGWCFNRGDGPGAERVYGGELAADILPPWLRLLVFLPDRQNSHWIVTPALAAFSQKGMMVMSAENELSRRWELAVAEKGRVT